MSEYLEGPLRRQGSLKFMADRPFQTTVLYSCLLYMTTLLGTTNLTDAMCCAQAASCDSFYVMHGRIKVI